MHPAGIRHPTYKTVPWWVPIPNYYSRYKIDMAKWICGTLEYDDQSGMGMHQGCKGLHQKSRHDSGHEQLDTENAINFPNESMADIYVATIVKS